MRLQNATKAVMLNVKSYPKRLAVNTLMKGNSTSLFFWCFQRTCSCWRTKTERTQKSSGSSAQQGERRTFPTRHGLAINLKPNWIWFAARCLKATQYASIAWRILEPLSTARLPTEKDPSITGPLTRTESPTLVLDLWVLNGQLRFC